MLVTCLLVCFGVDGGSDLPGVEVWGCEAIARVVLGPSDGGQYGKLRSGPVPMVVIVEAVLLSRRRRVVVVPREECRISGVRFVRERANEEKTVRGLSVSVDQVSRNRYRVMRLYGDLNPEMDSGNPASIDREFVSGLDLAK